MWVGQRTTTAAVCAMVSNGVAATICKRGQVADHTAAEGQLAEQQGRCSANATAAAAGSATAQASSICSQHAVAAVPACSPAARLLHGGRAGGQGTRAPDGGLAAGGSLRGLHGGSVEWQQQMRAVQGTGAGGFFHGSHLHDWVTQKVD